MTISDPIRYKAAFAVFKLAVKTENSGIHRITNREPKGKGWVQCKNEPQGIMCKPDKVLEAIEYYKIACEIYPGIVALNQIAVKYLLLGEKSKAKEYFTKLKEQAEKENNEIYLQGALEGIRRCE